MRTIAHTKTVKDWKGLIQAGVDATTHTVEDAPVDAELLSLIKARPGFPNISALTSELQGGSVPRAPGQRPEWLKDPLLTTLKCPGFLENWGRSFEKREPAPRDGGLWSQNTVQIRKAGATIIMGSHDAGGQRVIGWGSHWNGSLRELDRHDAEQAIAAATSVSTRFIGVDGWGHWRPGKAPISSCSTQTRSTSGTTDFAGVSPRQTGRSAGDEGTLAGVIRRSADNPWSPRAAPERLLLPRRHPNDGRSVDVVAERSATTRGDQLRRGRKRG
jgi:hypothetical protein